MKRVSAESAIALMSPPAPIRTVNPTQPGGDDIAADKQEVSPMHSNSAGEKASGLQSDFDGAIEAFRQAAEVLVKGESKPCMALFSRSDDVTLANPLGPPRPGPAEVDRARAEAAAQLSDGSMLGFEEVSRYSTSDLGYIVQIERAQARLAGSGATSPIALRATMIFRCEGDTWRIVHRHADPIMTPRPISTVVETQELTIQVRGAPALCC
jgi:ketosteroid isomerase-like protein